MDKKLKKYLTIILIVVVAALFLWFVVIWPMYEFKKDEKMLEDAAKRYYELNSTELPTGSRIATVSMQTLYHKSYLKEDFYIPYTKEPCSLKDSWVKVKKENGEYKYYTNLKCGVLESNVDNNGPKIKLKGSDTITIDLGEEYKEPGVKSIKDDTDGKMKTSVVTIKNDEVNTNETGTYTVTYTALDSLKNKTTVTRTVNVVSKIKNAVNKATDNKGYYIGANPNNYISLSGMMFRIIGVDGDNVKIVAEEDVANVNYTGITSWLDYYMEHINEDAKKLLVKNEYCNMTVTDTTLDTTECASTTKERYAYIPSVVDVNKAEDNTGNFLRPSTMSWIANEKNKDTAYTTRNIFFGDYRSARYYPDKKSQNYGVRPVLTIKGDTLVKTGNGTFESPYTFGETKTGQTDDLINTRNTGEYINYSGKLWRIVEVNEDGTTKIILDDTIKQDGKRIETHYQTNDNAKIYNPKQKGNVGYYINNKASEFIDTTYFVNKNIEVPIYKSEIAYGKEESTKEYKVKLSAPNMYEMFSAYSYKPNTMRSYWLINSSKAKKIKATITDIGVVQTDMTDYTEFGIRVVGNLNKSVLIVKGKGTYNNPYTITK